MKITNISHSIVGIILVLVNSFPFLSPACPSATSLAILYWSYKISLALLGTVFISVAMARNERNGLTVAKLLYNTKVYLLIASNIVAISCLWFISFTSIENPSSTVFINNISKDSFEVSAGVLLGMLIMLLTASIIHRFRIKNSRKVLLNNEKT